MKTNVFFELIMFVACMHWTRARAFVTRAGPGTATGDNSPLLAEILSLKQEMAELLGHSSYADLSTARKMAGSVQPVKDLTAMLLAAARPKARDEAAAVTAFARHNQQKNVPARPRSNRKRRRQLSL